MNLWGVKSEELLNSLIPRGCTTPKNSAKICFVCPSNPAGRRSGVFLIRFMGKFSRFILAVAIFLVAAVIIMGGKLPSQKSPASDEPVLKSPGLSAQEEPKEA